MKRTTDFLRLAMRWWSQFCFWHQTASLAHFAKVRCRG